MNGYKGFKRTVFKKLLKRFNLKLLYSFMSDVDDEVVKPIKRSSSQKVLEKLKLIEKKLEELINKPKQVKKPMDKDSDAYKNKRSVYVNKMSNKDIKFPKKETLEHYEIKLDDQEKHIKLILYFTKTIERQLCIDNR